MNSVPTGRMETPLMHGLRAHSENSRRSAPAAIVLAMSLLIAGCQNRLRVQVELLDASGEVEITEATFATAIDRALFSLDRFEKLLAKLEIELGDCAAHIDGAAKKDLHKINEHRSHGRRLRATLGTLESYSEIADRVRLYVDAVAEFCGTARDYREFLVKGLAPSEQLTRALRGFDEVWGPGILAVRAEAFSASAQAAGFGGFTAVAAHQIDASDTRYAHVLKAQPVGRPFTLVDSKAFGDSTIIFVQESPTQMRVFSVDMDPTQLVQNVMYITDKALQAATKFMGPLP